jgi:hypothetical protein
MTMLKAMQSEAVMETLLLSQNTGFLFWKMEMLVTSL